MKEQPNLKYVDELSSGSEEFKKKLISIIKREFPKEKEIFIKNFSEKKYGAAAENVHKIKHKISLLGFEIGYQTTIDFEMELIKGEHSLYSKFMLILETIERYLETL